MPIFNERITFLSLSARVYREWNDGERFELDLSDREPPELKATTNTTRSILSPRIILASRCKLCPPRYPLPSRFVPLCDEGRLVFRLQPLVLTFVLPELPPMAARLAIALDSLVARLLPPLPEQLLVQSLSRVANLPCTIWPFGAR